MQDYGLDVSSKVTDTKQNIHCQNLHDYYQISSLGAGAAVEDNIPPVTANCPATIFAEATGTFTSVEWTAPTATDNGVNVPLASGPTFNSAFFFAGTTGPFVYRFTDNAGNTAQCEIYIFVTGKFFFVKYHELSNRSPYSIIHVSLKNSLFQRKRLTLSLRVISHFQELPSNVFSKY